MIFILIFLCFDRGTRYLEVGGGLCQWIYLLLFSCKSESAVILPKFAVSTHSLEFLLYICNLKLIFLVLPLLSIFPPSGKPVPVCSSACSNCRNSKLLPVPCVIASVRFGHKAGSLAPLYQPFSSWLEHPPACSTSRRECLSCRNVVVMRKKGTCASSLTKMDLKKEEVG